MQKELIATGRTTEEAIENGLSQLNTTRENVEIEVVETSNKGFFGFIGQKDAKVLIKYNEDETSEIKEFVEELLKHMGISGKAEIKSDDNIFNINISGDGMGLIIGRRGETLDALQHIVQLYVNKKYEKFFKVRIDTEDYRAKREEALSNLALGMAKKVVRTKKEIVLEPMKAYERRIIHTALQDYPKIKTYSIGDEPNRKLVVAYKYNNSKDVSEKNDSEE